MKSNYVQKVKMFRRKPVAGKTLLDQFKSLTVAQRNNINEYLRKGAK
jgi:hypothetical protein